MAHTDVGLGSVPRVEHFDLSIGDPAVAELFAGWLGVSTSNGLPAVGEMDALGLTAYGRGRSLIASTIAGLPLKAYTKKGDERLEVPSFLDRPQGPYAMTKTAWVGMTLLQLIDEQETFWRHIYNGAGQLVGLLPIHPTAVTKVEWIGFGKQYTVRKEQGDAEKLSDLQMTQVMAPNAYGNRGIPLRQQYKKAFQTAIAGEQAAARSFTGALIAGMVSMADSEDVIDPDEAAVVKAQLNAKVLGADHANDIAFVNANLKFTPWTMTNADAQYMESRAFQVEEFARILGLPPHLLAAVDKQTSWGTGIAEQNIGLSRYNLRGWTDVLENALSDLLPDGVYAEFDYKGLLQGSPADEIHLIIEQVAAGLMTPEYGAALLQLPKPPKPEPEPAPEEVPANE